MATRRRWLRAALATVLAAFLPGGPVAAHAILMDSTPAPGDSLPGGMQAIRLRFNSRIDHERSRLVLIGPDRTPTVLHIDPESEAGELRASATLSPGEAVLRWQVLATDGHITRGEVRFTVTGR
jgi:methionine-rich copper-binding protein CopC